MSRSDVLVDADWLEAHLGDPGVVLVEVDEDTSAYDKGHIRGAVKIDWKTDLQDPVRRDFVDKARLRGAAVRAGHRQRRHRRAVRRQQQLVRRLRVLVLQAVRPPERQAARRRPQEVGARLPRAGRPRCRSAPATTYTAKEQDTSIRAFRDEVVAAIGTQNLVDVRSPGRVRRPAARPGAPAAGAGAARAATSRPRRTCPGPRRPTKTARSSRTTSCAALYGDEAGVDFGKDTIAYCRIGERSAHTWFVLHELLGQAEREELRRLVDRVRLAGRRPDRAGRAVK